jgi:predicted ATPase
VIHLRSVATKRASAADAGYPWSVPAVGSLGTLELTAPVTFFVGENGSGKSTVLEGIAAAARLPAVGAAPIEDDRTLSAARALGNSLRLTWDHRTHRGFFLRAEDFFGFAKSVHQMRTELQERLAQLQVEYEDRSAYALQLASGPMRASLGELTEKYGVDLDANSHGQSFLLLFQSRFVPGGLYLLDEPEAPLSPQSQLALLALLDEMVRQDAQFIIATHSPILLAFPGAAILDFDRTPVQPVAYEETAHVRVTKDFLLDPQRYLRHLFADAPLDHPR